jgi:hypothetical protein
MKWTLYGVWGCRMESARHYNSARSKWGSLGAYPNWELRVHETKHLGWQNGILIANSRYLNVATDRNCCYYGDDTSTLLTCIIPCLTLKPGSSNLRKGNVKHAWTLQNTDLCFLWFELVVGVRDENLGNMNLKLQLKSWPAANISSETISI